MAKVSFIGTLDSINVVLMSSNQLLSILCGMVHSIETSVDLRSPGGNVSYTSW